MWQDTATARQEWQKAQKPVVTVFQPRFKPSISQTQVQTITPQTPFTLFCDRW